jgi:DMSO/TMAO reductase YedYZ molybdopterin-dependent catalytic subunit
MADDAGLAGQVKRKLIDTKERWAREGRLLTGETAAPRQRRLPPGQRLTQDWPVLDLGVHPNVATADWQLAVGGLVDNPVTWRWEDLERQPRFAHVSDIHCVTAWSRYDNRWEGVSARHLLSVVRPRSDARFIIFRSYDGYATNLPLAAFDDDDVLLATSWEGQPIARAHGGPVRIVVPKLYFWKSAKWVKHIWFTDKDAKGFWEVRGYHNHGDPWKEERYG